MKALREVVLIAVAAIVLGVVALSVRDAAGQVFPRPGQCIDYPDGARVCLPCPSPKPGAPVQACGAPAPVAPVEVPVDHPLAIAALAGVVGLVAVRGLRGVR